MSGFTHDSPQISASPHQLDLAPYASGPYNAQWNALGLLHDKHTLRSSRILGEMEVDEPWLGLWIPLNYQVDMEAIFKQNGGGCCCPGELGCFHLKQENAQKPLEGPRFENFYLHPHFTKYTPFAPFLLILFP